MIKIKLRGDFSKTEKYLKKARNKTRIDEQANAIAKLCVERLKKATPVDSGLTAESWDFEISIAEHRTSIVFLNRNIQNGVNVALLLEYGHGTSNGAWIEGKEYIAPVIQQTYLDVVNNTWKELTKL